MTIRVFSAIILIFILPLRQTLGQSTLPEYETRVQQLFSHISAKIPDAENKAIHDSISIEIEKALGLQGAFDYPFNTLKFLGKVTSNDKKVRILTWNMSSSDATNTYYGFIMHKTGNENPDIFKFSPDYLVYEIVDVKVSGDNNYTLLCYDPQNMFITRKIIDVLWFNNKLPVFGKPIFHYNKKTVDRIVFEYSAKVRMSLTWNKKMNMIVFDHLSPSSPQYTGNYQFYGPDLSFDGLTFENGFWEHRSNIDVRN